MQTWVSNSLNFVIGFLFFCIIEYILGPELIKKIEIWGVNSLNNTIINIFPEFHIILDEYILWIVLFFIASCLLKILFWLKNSIFLISEVSMGYKLAKVAKDKNGRYIFSSVLNVNEEMSNNKIADAVKKQDEFINKFIKRYKFADIGYYGIAHTPLVFRAGFLVGDQDNVHLYHKLRKNDSLFKEWIDDSTSFSFMNGITKLPQKNSIDSNELIVAISSSLDIQECEIAKLHPENKHLIFFKGNEIGFDYIISYQDAEKAREFIWSNVRSYVKKHNIQKLHLVIASSVAFTFFLGMGYSRQHDPECIVYHYERPDYKWGINIKKDSSECFVEL